MSNLPGENAGEASPFPQIEVSSVPPAKPPPVAGSSIPKPVVGGYSSAALLGVLLFFLPWVNISCQGVTLVSQSGLQMALGDFSENKNASKELQERLGAMNPGSGSPFGGSQGSSGTITINPSGNDQQKIEKLRTKTGPFIPALGVVAGLLLAGAIGLITLARGSPGVPLLPLIGGAVATVSLLVTIVIKLPIESAMFADTPPDVNIEAFISVNHSVWFFLTLLLSLTVLAGGIVHYMVVAKTAR